MWGAMLGLAGAAIRLLRGALHAVRSTLVIAALALCATSAVLQGRANAQSADIPLQLLPTGTGSSAGYRLAINVGLGSGAPKTYLFDTGSSLFNAAYSAQWWPSSITPDTSPLARNVKYTYSDGGGYLGNIVSVPSISFYASSTATIASYTLPTLSPGYQISAVTEHFLPVVPENSIRRGFAQ
jgi:hypothetical protein